MRQVVEAPWKASNEVWRWLVYPKVRASFFLNGIPWGQGWRFYGVPIVLKHRGSQMLFGPGFQLRSTTRSNPLGPNRPVILNTWTANATLQIGANFGMSGGSIVVADRITIGDNVTIGANSTVVDTDFHALDPRERRLYPQNVKTAPVVIEDDVFIGMNCLVLKGVSIGQGSVAGAGSVVTKSVPPNVIVAGNPAQIVRVLAT